MKKLFVLSGPTGVGKTSLSFEISQMLNSPIISCDSRQIYKETVIGTAAPLQEELLKNKHYFIGSKSIHDYYSASMYEHDVINLLEKDLFKNNDNILMTGGSMMYIDAVCNGIDFIPDVKPEIRKGLYQRFEKDGLNSILKELQNLDPEYCRKVDLNNHKRIIHALEVCLSTGKPFTSFHKKKKKKRSFEIIKLCINRDRKELYGRIDARVLDMIDKGLEKEAKDLYPFKNLNSLNTVGYKEMFKYFEGEYTLEKAIERIQFNTHKYARKQLIWFRKDKDYTWFNADDKKEILDYIQSVL